METSIQLKKKDIIIALAIGEVAGCLIAIILKNIGQLVPEADIVPIWIWLVFFPLFCLAWLLFTFILSKVKTIFYQLGKFVLVGGLNFLLDLGILNLLIFLTSIASGWLFSLFKGASFIIAVVNSYLLNKFWTFKKQAVPEQSVQQTGKEFMTFVAVSLIGMGLNNLVASALVNWVGPQWGVAESLWANIGAIAAGFISMFWNFVGYKFFVFKKK